MDTDENADGTVNKPTRPTLSEFIRVHPWFRFFHGVHCASSTPACPGVRVATGTLFQREAGPGSPFDGDAMQQECRPVGAAVNRMKR